MSEATVGKVPEQVETPKLGLWAGDNPIDVAFINALNNEAEELVQCRAENERLRAENVRLRRLNSDCYATMRHSVKKLFKKLEEINDENLKAL